MLAKWKRPTFALWHVLFVSLFTATDNRVLTTFLFSCPRELLWWPWYTPSSAATSLAEKLCGSLFVMCALDYSHVRHVQATDSSLFADCRFKNGFQFSSPELTQLAYWYSNYVQTLWKHRISRFERANFLVLNFSWGISIVFCIINRMYV